MGMIAVAETRGSENDEKTVGLVLVGSSVP